MKKAKNAAKDVVDGDWGYDGDAERPDAWNSSVNGNSDQLRWTNKANGSKPSPPSRQNSNSKSPFALGDDDEEESNHSGSVSPSNRPLPDDARDLVVDDQEMVEEAKIRGRMRGEPQTNAPVHVYVHQEPGSSSPEVEEVHESTDVPGQGATSEEMTQEDMPGGEIIRKLEEISEGPSNATRVASIETPYDEDNPWA